MKFVSILWCLVWGGMFTGIYAIQSPRFLSSPFGLFQGLRAFAPALAAYLCMIWIMVRKSSLPYSGTPLAFMLYYCLLGIISSIFLSPQTITSLYWAALYLSPLLVVWLALDRPQPAKTIQRLININYLVFIVITASLIPQSLSAGFGKISHDQFYTLAFGMGQIRSNGVGRFALVVSIVAFIRFLTGRNWRRFFWLALLLSSLFLLLQTQSRTALLGLAIVSSLFVFLRGLDWRLVLIGPISSYLVWLSGVQWRLQGQLNRAVFLTGREYTWQKGLAMIKQSPFLGWGFHADRLLLDSEHMHNSYLHSMIHSGFFGGVLFLSAIVAFWAMVKKKELFRRIRAGKEKNSFLLMESILIVGFLTSRSFFESTAAFYGVDLLLIVPAMAHIMLWPLKAESYQGD